MDRFLLELSCSSRSNAIAPPFDDHHASTRKLGQTTPHRIDWQFLHLPVFFPEEQRLLLMNTPDRDAHHKLEIVVFAAGDEALVVPLPALGKLILGRADDADVRIDDPSVSRRHAVLHLGAPMRIEDLGSSNGT